VGNTDIYIGPRSGNEDGKVQLTNLPDYDENLSRSPNGAAVAFDDDGNGLYRVTVSSPLVETAIPNTADVDGGRPAWQPVSH
jgi:Tol biopolymer transport system component